MVEAQHSLIEYSHPEYTSLLEEINLHRKAELQNLLQQALVDFPEDMAVVMVGSDGKMERHPQSKTELVFISEQEYPTLPMNAALLLYPHQDEYSLEFDFTNIPGYYSLEQEVPFSYQYQNEKHVFPGFILNSILLHGSGETHFQARKRILTEMAIETPLSHRINKYMRTQLRDYRRAMQKGGTTKEIYFDEELGKVFYNDTHNILGFKGSFIRGIQRTTGMYTAKLATIYPDYIDEMADTFPTRTIDRIKSLAENNMIPPDMATHTIRAYNWFLQRHHEVQELFKKHGEECTVAAEFDKDAFGEHKTRALEYTYSI